MSSSHKEHIPVFLDAVLDIYESEHISPRTLFDGTFGRGGHSLAILRKFPQVTAFAMDGDEEAVEYARSNYKNEVQEGRLRIVHDSYRNFKLVRAAQGWPEKFDLMLLDLGVSSPQLDQADRGFSFYNHGPLDMRMNRKQKLTAADVVNQVEEQELAKIFIELGEIPRPFRVVRAIVHDRKNKPFTTTEELAGLIERVDGWQKKGSHPATRYFMALRLHVNAELETLELALPDLIDSLDENGLLAVITFHSLEDRLVKNILKDNLHRGELVNRKVIKPSDEELKANPRSRSAKLRVFRKSSRGTLTRKQKYNLEHSLTDEE